jgi:short-subunit dehydrogenase
VYTLIDQYKIQENKYEKTIAIIGTAPGVGFALAEKFGKERYNVALLARNVEKLNMLTDDLLKKSIKPRFSRPTY